VCRLGQPRTLLSSHHLFSVLILKKCFYFIIIIFCFSIFMGNLQKELGVNVVACVLQKEQQMTRPNDWIYASYIHLD